MIGVTTKRKAYERDPWDVAICAWCTNPFDRTKAQADRGVRYCGKRCIGFGAAMHHPDEHFARLGRLGSRVRRARQAARLETRLAGKTPLECYRLGCKDTRDRRTQAAKQDRKGT